jgi:hypothetical protein
MLTPTVAQLITEDRIREAEAWRLAEAARPPRARAAGAPRLRRPAWPLARPRAGVTTR